MRQFKWRANHHFSSTLTTTVPKSVHIYLLKNSHKSVFVQGYRSSGYCALIGLYPHQKDQNRLNTRSHKENYMCIYNSPHSIIG